MGPLLPALVTGGLGLIGDLFNFGQQKKTQSWQKRAQEITWQREDNATQRRVADLKAAGLNPVLAAGSAAAASSPIQIGTPQLPTTAVDKAETMMNLMRQKEDIALTTAEKHRVDAQTMLTNDQRYTEWARRNQIENQRALTLRELQRAELEYEMRKRDFGIIQKQGVRSDITTGQTTDALNTKEYLFNLASKLLKTGGSSAHALAEILDKF